MKPMTRWVGVALTILLSACGGGGGGSDSVGTAPVAPTPTTISGSIAPGPVAGAAVQLLGVDSQGRTTLIQEVRSGSNGEYAFNATVTAETVVMVSATGGSWLDPVRKASAALDTRLRAVDVWTGAVRRINLTPYTEVEVRDIEKAKAPDWSAAGIRTANQAAAVALGVVSITDFTRVDLTLPVGSTAPKEDDLAHALANGTFLGFWHRLEAAPATITMAAALDALNQIVNVDPEDDRLWPAYVGGTVDFVDATVLNADDKLRIKGLILYGKDTLPTAFTVAAAMPKGLSSGTALAGMPDNQFRLVGQSPGRTHFNQRGALVAYGDGDGSTSRHVLYTASVAEVFADGDVGIGRWNGGVEMVTTPSGSASVTNANILSTAGSLYAAATATSQVPACGSRRLALAGSTQLLFGALNSGGTGPALTLTSDSSLSLLYLGNVQTGADIGVRTTGGDVVRLTSNGGLAHPELAGLQQDAENDVFLNVPVSTLVPAGTTAQLRVRPAGPGARKAAALLQIRVANGDIYAATLAFVGADAAADTQGCVQPGATGIGISPRPADGSYYVALDHQNESLFMGAPKDVTFGASGELATVLSPWQYGGPAYELAGNAYASIGRVTVTSGSAALGNLVQRSQPYAVIQPGAVVPTSGSAQYRLIAATAVTAERGSGAAQLAPGLIDSASVTVYFNQYPIGTTNAYGMARFTITGHFSGIAFGSDVNAAKGYGPIDVMTSGNFISDINRVSGSFGGPGGEYLAVLYRDGVDGIPIKAALLFKREGS